MADFRVSVGAAAAALLLCGGVHATTAMNAGAAGTSHQNIVANQSSTAVNLGLSTGHNGVTASRVIDMKKDNGTTKVAHEPTHWQNKLTLSERAPSTQHSNAAFGIPNSFKPLRPGLYDASSIDKDQNSAGQANFAVNGRLNVDGHYAQGTNTVAPDDERLERIFGSVVGNSSGVGQSISKSPFKTLSLLSEDQRGKMAADHADHPIGAMSDARYAGGFGAAPSNSTTTADTATNAPHNILRQGLHVNPVKECLAAYVHPPDGAAATLTSGDLDNSCRSDGQDTDERNSTNAHTSACDGGVGCVWTEVAQSTPNGSVEPVECRATVACDPPTGSPAHAALTQVNTTCIDAIKINLAEAMTKASTGGATTPAQRGALPSSAKDLCAKLTEWECRRAGTVADRRYASSGSGGALGSAKNVSDIDINEQSLLCYLDRAPSIMQVADPSLLSVTDGSGTTKIMDEGRTPLYANPMWPHVLGKNKLSFKTSALKGDTMKSALNRGQPYETKKTGASGQAENFAFDGYIPDMTYIRPEYDVNMGGYEGWWKPETVLDWKDGSAEGLYTWVWDGTRMEYVPTKSSLIMTTENGSKVIQPDPDAVSRSQRQVSLDTMLQFADAIGITAVDNEQALYEWKLDALQTLLDRINTSHKATAFTYAATGHQLLNLLERFQAHSGATDDLLYYILSVMGQIAGDVDNAISVFGAFYGGGSNDRDSNLSVFPATGAAVDFSATTTEGTFEALNGSTVKTLGQQKLNDTAKTVYGAFNDGQFGAGQGGASYIPGDPSAVSRLTNGNARIKRARFTTNASNYETLQGRMGFGTGSAANPSPGSSLWNLQEAKKAYDKHIDPKLGSGPNATVAPGTNLTTQIVHPGNLDLRSKDNAGGESKSAVKVTSLMEANMIDENGLRLDNLDSRVPGADNYTDQIVNNATLGMAYKFDYTVLTPSSGIEWYYENTCAPQPYNHYTDQSGSTQVTQSAYAKATEKISAVRSADDTTYNALCVDESGAVCDAFDLSYKLVVQTIELDVATVEYMGNYFLDEDIAQFVHDEVGDPIGFENDILYGICTNDSAMIAKMTAAAPAGYGAGADDSPLCGADYDPDVHGDVRCDPKITYAAYDDGFPILASATYQYRNCLVDSDRTNPNYASGGGNLVAGSTTPTTGSDTTVAAASSDGGVALFLTDLGLSGTGSTDVYLSDEFGSCSGTCTIITDAETDCLTTRSGDKGGYKMRLEGDIVAAPESPLNGGRWAAQNHNAPLSQNEHQEVVMSYGAGDAYHPSPNTAGTLPTATESSSGNQVTIVNQPAGPKSELGV